MVSKVYQSIYPKDRKVTFKKENRLLQETLQMDERNKI